MISIILSTERIHEVKVTGCTLESRTGFAAPGMPGENEYFVRVIASLDGYGKLLIDRPPLSINRPPGSWQCGKSVGKIVFSKFNPSDVRFVEDPRGLGMFGGLLMLICAWVIAGGWRFFVRE